MNNGQPSSPRTVPPTLTSLVDRPRLDELLTNDVRKAPVTLVSAGAGSGKTTAVASWLQAGSFTGAGAWVNIDDSDRDPPMLRRDVFASLAGGADDLSLFEPTDTLVVGVRRFFEAGEISAAPTVLVLDDLQEITEPALLEELRDLIEHCPPALRLVLISRSDPPIRLQRWRISGALAELRARDLAFRPPEAAQLLDQYGIELTSDQMACLMACTEGWAAGLRLAAMSLDAQAIDEGLAGFAGDQHSVAEYLVGEVLNHLPERTQNFLLRLSVVDEASVSLAEEIGDEPGAVNVLRELATDNELLFRFGANRQRFRLHPLLRQLLYHRLAADDPELARGQHRRAAHWFDANGEPVLAARQAVLSGDEQLLHDVVTASAIPLVFTDQGPALARALRAGDDAAPPRGTDGSLQAAICRVLDGDDAVAVSEIARVRESWLRTGGGTAAEEAALSVLDLRVTAGSLDSEATILAAEEAMRHSRALPPALEPMAAQYRTIALGHLGSALLWAGYPARAEAYLLQAARESNAFHLTVIRALCLSHLAILHGAAGATHLAQQYAVAALSLAAPGGSAAAHLALAQVHLLRGDLAAATQSRHYLLDHGAGLPDLAARVVEAGELLSRAATTKAADVLDEAYRDAHRKGAVAALLDQWCARLGTDLALREGRYAEVLARPGDADAAIQVRLARAEIGLHRHGEALDRLRPLLSEPEPLLAVEAWSTYAVAHYRSHHDDAAVKAMSHALEAAAAEGLVQPFGLFGVWCLPVVRACHEVSPSRFARRVLDTIRDEVTVTVAGNAGYGLVADLIEPLTDRELIVLQYLPTLRRNTEIGESLFVTVNTVKAHLKSVYRKLGVNSRRAAVERARELNLL